MRIIQNDGVILYRTILSVSDFNSLSSVYGEKVELAFLFREV